MYSARRAKLAGDFCDLSAAVEPQTGSFPQHVSQMRPPLPEASLVSQPVGPAVHRASYKTLLLLFPPWELVIATLKTHFPLLLSMWIPPDRKQEGERNNNCISYDREMNNFNCVCACSVCKCVCKCVLWGIVCVCLPCDIVERLGVVIHKASTQIEASILFPQEKESERNRDRNEEIEEVIQLQRKLQ